MKTYITSDLHWGHKNIMNFCPVSRARFRNDVDYMNEAMVREWNDLIEPQDLVYILGDVAFLPAPKAVEYMRRLNGRKILVQGNHDRKLLQDAGFRDCFEEIHHYLDITYNGTKCVMSHFPFLEWDQMHRGSIMFYGHLHGGTTGMEKYRCMDVGMDATGEIAISMERAINRVKDNEIKRHHV
jgi:calcineurin-like phosphoesterase family protein